MKKLFTVFAFVLSLSSFAHAGILIEPYIGYEGGERTYKTKGASREFSDSLPGAAYGLRLGYKFLMPWVALDYTSASGTAKRDSNYSTDTKDYEFSKSSMGLVVGVDLPFVVRLWAGAGITNDLIVKGGNRTVSGRDLVVPDAKFSGSYVKGGIGFTLIPLLSLNIEYKINDFKKYDSGSGEGPVDKDTVYDSMNHNALMVSVSVPLNL